MLVSYSKIIQDSRNTLKTSKIYSAQAFETQSSLLQENRSVHPAEGKKRLSREDGVKQNLISSPRIGMRCFSLPTGE